MNYENQFNDPQDRALWEIAKRRASFKRHLLSYVVVIGFLWAIWALGGKHNDSRFPWPIWATLGWGIGIVFHYLGAYAFPREMSVEKEFEKLKKEQNK
jgi:hypothetical protein